MSGKATLGVDDQLTIDTSDAASGSASGTLGQVPPSPWRSPRSPQKGTFMQSNRPSDEQHSWRRGPAAENNLSRTSTVLTSGLFARRRPSNTTNTYDTSSWRTQK